MTLSPVTNGPVCPWDVFGTFHNCLVVAPVPNCLKHVTEKFRVKIDKVNVDPSSRNKRFQWSHPCTWYAASQIIKKICITKTSGCVCCNLNEKKN